MTSRFCPLLHSFIHTNPDSFFKSSHLSFGQVNGRKGSKAIVIVKNKPVQMAIGVQKSLFVESQDYSLLTLSTLIIKQALPSYIALTSYSSPHLFVLVDPR